MTEQRRLAAIVSADVAGYSRLMGRDESGTLAALKALRSEIVDPRIAKHNGRIVKTTGDGLLLEFASVVDAVRCVIEVQTAVAEKAAEVPEDRRIAFRVGVNIGDILIDGDDIFGDGVNIAARLQEIAAPGGVCASSRVHDDIRDRLDTTFEDGGAQTLKNIARPVQVWRWTPGVASASVPPPAHVPLALPDKPSIAVLPFQNMSGDPEQEYFADGMVEDIITALSRVPLLFVIARNSAFTYKGRAVDVRQVGRELGVRYVLEGSVRKAGNRIRITGQLVDATTGNHIWADRYDGLLEDVFDLQDRITANVAGAIEPKVQQAEIHRAQAKSTDNLSAYDLFLRALPCMYEAKEESISEALRLLDRASTADPNLSSAYGLKAICHVSRKAQGWGSVEMAEKSGLEAARLAVETGRDDPNALARAGLALAYLGGDHREGLAHVERATALNPNCALATRFAGYISWYLGDHERSLAFFEQARRFSPVDPSMAELYTGMGFPHLFTGKYEQAIAWADRALRERPNWGPALWLKVAALASADGPREELDKSVKQLLALHPDSSRRSIMRRFPAVPAVRASFELALKRAGLPH